jgi:hypothetical protein
MEPMTNVVVRESRSGVFVGSGEGVELGARVGDGLGLEGVLLAESTEK